jgi:hypothetical protein
MNSLDKVIDNSIRKAFDAGYTLGLQDREIRTKKNNQECMTYETYLIKRAVIELKLFKILKVSEQLPPAGETVSVPTKTTEPNEQNKV